MTIKSFECADCGAPVPYGRLACPSCGALLAAVAGGPPPAVRVVETPAPAVGAVPDVDAPAPPQKPRARTGSRTSPKEPVTREHLGKAGTNGSPKPTATTSKDAGAPGAAAPQKAVAAPAAATPPSVPNASPPVPDASPHVPDTSPTVVDGGSEHSSTSSAPVAAQLAYLVEPSPDAPNYVIPDRHGDVAPVRAGAAGGATVAVDPRPRGWPGNGGPPTLDDHGPTNGHTYLDPEPPLQGSSGYVIHDPYIAVDEASDARADAGADPAGHARESAVDANDGPGSPWPPLLQPEPTILARPYGGAANGTNGTPRPGAYLPPSAAIPAASAPPVSASPGRASTDSAPMAAPVRAADLASGASGASAALAVNAPGRFDPAATISAAFAGIDRARIAEVGGWFVVAGSTVALLGFLLPWSVVVIGSQGNGGYLDDWGLASPTHLFAVLGLAGVLALGVLQNRVPVWLRTGVLGLLTGGLLVGLTWPYAIGPLGAELGAMATFVGGLMLIGGGLVAIWATRHAEAGPAV